MTAPTRHFLLIILAILQLIAPLVHAHTSGGLDRAGLHVPGLEMIDTGHSERHWSALEHRLGGDGLIIGVNTGIRQSLLSLLADSQQYFYAAVAVPRCRLAPARVLFNGLPSSSILPVSAVTQWLPAAPRAPPVN